MIAADKDEYLAIDETGIYWDIYYDDNSFRLALCPEPQDIDSWSHVDVTYNTMDEALLALKEALGYGD